MVKLSEKTERIKNENRNNFDRFMRKAEKDLHNFYINGILNPNRKLIFEVDPEDIDPKLREALILDLYAFSPMYGRKVFLNSDIKSDNAKVFFYKSAYYKNNVGGADEKMREKMEYYAKKIVNDYDKIYYSEDKYKNRWEKPKKITELLDIDKKLRQYGKKFGEVENPKVIFNIAKERLKSLRECYHKHKNDETYPHRDWLKKELKIEEKLIEKYEKNKNYEDFLNDYCRSINYYPNDTPKKTINRNSNYYNRNKVKNYYGKVYDKEIHVLPETLGKHGKFTKDKQIVLGYIAETAAHQQTDYFRIMYMPEPSEMKCGNFMIWTPLLNKMFIRCSFHTDLDFPIRLILPCVRFGNKFTFIEKYGRIGKHFLKEYHYMGFLFVPFKDDRNKKVKHQLDGFLFLIFYPYDGSINHELNVDILKEYSPLILRDIFAYKYIYGMMVKIKTNTYDEMNILINYLNAKIYYSLKYNFIIFFSNQNFNNNYLRKIGLGKCFNYYYIKRVSCNTDQEQYDFYMRTKNQKYIDFTVIRFSNTYDQDLKNDNVSLSFEQIKNLPRKLPELLKLKGRYLDNYDSNNINNSDNNYNYNLKKKQLGGSYRMIKNKK
jgi:hypothetical protein